MNKLFTLTFIFFISLTALFAQSDAQHTLITKRTADWCPRCGTWGWTFVKDGLQEWENKDIIYWAMHHSGGLSTPTSMEMANNFGGSYQPIFRVNQDDLDVLSSNVNAKIDEASLLIDALNGFPALIKVGVTPIMNADNSISANVIVQFDEGTDTDYTVGVYLLRDSLVANQASVGSSAIHPFVLDQAFTATTFGDLIKDGNTINDGEIFTISTSLDNVTPHTSNIANMHVAAVLWREANGQRIFINGDVSPVQMASNTTSVNPLTFKHAIKNGQLSLEVEESLTQEARLDVFTLDGRQVPTSHQSISNTTISVDLEFTQVGSYIVRLMDQGRVSSKQIYIVD